MTKRFFIIISFFIFSLLLLANFSLVAGDLEQNYPAVPSGQDGVVLNSQTNIFQLIKIIFYWAIALSIMAVAISLIYGGIVYLTSAGDSGKMSQGKKRIIDSAIGLVILFSVFLLLQTINPELTIIDINKETLPVSGVILLNDIAYHSPEVKNDLRSDDPEISAKRLEELLSENDITKPQARNLYFSLGDSTREYGELENFIDTDEPNVQKQNFKDFKAYAIHFLPETNARVVIHYDKSSVFYPNPSFVYQYPQCSNYASYDEMFCKLKTLSSQWMSQTILNSFQPHPPLSVTIENLTRGVYFASYYNYLGFEVFFRSSRPDFRGAVSNAQGEFSFAYAIINNWQETNYQQRAWEKKSNYLAIVHEEPNYRGNLRIFFENFLLPLSDGTKLDFVGNMPNNGFFLGDETAIFPKNGSPLADLPNKTIIPFYPRSYLYGRVRKFGSVQVFEINAEKPVSCEILLCTKTFFRDCYAYLLNKTKPESDNVLAYGPLVEENPVNNMTSRLLYGLIEPRNIPKEVKYSVVGDNGTEEKKLELRNHVESIKIIGDCFVAIFENTVSDKADDISNCRSSFGPDDNLAGRKQYCWPGNEEPGSHSQVFLPNRAFAELKSEEIKQCGNWLTAIKLGFGQGQSCASSIAVFPIKNFISQTPVAGGMAGSWTDCLTPSQITNRQQQVAHTSIPLVEFLNCLAGNYSPKDGGNACGNWVITSISDSVETEMVMRQCVGENWTNATCAHNKYSDHYGGRNISCQGSSYAVDVDNIRDFTAFQLAAQNCLQQQLASPPSQQELNSLVSNHGNHYHIGLGKFYNCSGNTNDY